MSDTGKQQARSSPSTVQADALGQHSDRPLTIGQVVALLRPEFPDLSITKVRYLEDRGLLAPARTPGKYRKYSHADVRRLRTILTLQRDEFLPLEVIKQRVERAAVPLGTTGTATGALRLTPALRREQALYSLEELRETAGCDPDFIRTLSEYRVLDRPAGQGPVYTESDVEVARLCQVLARFGVEPRNLRLLVSSVEREAALVEQLTVPSLRSSHPDRREYGERLLADLGSLLSQLSALLLARELRRLL